MTPRTYTVVHAGNPFTPHRDRQVSTRSRRVRIATLAPKTTLPFICLVNGKPLMRDGWDARPQHGDIVTFVTLPQGGGGGSNPLQVVAMLAVTYFTMGAGAALWMPAGMAGTFTGAALSTAAFMAGSAVVNAFMPPPKPPSSQQAASMAAPSPTYSLSAQGNSARLGSAIPVQYGRHIAYPDFAAEPYAEFVGNEQYLYQLFVLGQGEHSIEAVRIEDTPIANFEDITYEVVAPGSAVTLFPSNVQSSIEVAGQEALTNTPLGPFVINAAGTLANYLAIDIVCPKGLFYANDQGGLNSKTVTFKVEAQTVDANGAGYGNWIVLGTETITAATNTPQRKSYRYAVTEARYQVKLTRMDTKDTSSRAGHDLNWAGARAYLPGSQSYGNLTLIAMRLKASNSLSQAASRRVNVISTRMLLTWNPTTGWSAPVATSSIAWAIADILRADYGAGLADANIDLAQLYVLDQVLTPRGDTFNGRFDNTISAWEALTKVSQCGRTKPYLQAGIVHFVRDQAQSIPVAMFGPTNMVRGSLSVDYLMPTVETADAITIQYFDAATWKPAEVTAALAGSTASNPSKMQLFGCTNRDQAWREGMYIAACNRYRRKMISHQTEMEGFIPTFGDLVALSHTRLSAAVSGEVTAWDAANLILTLAEPVTFTAGQTHYIGLRKRDGSFAGPYVATAGADEFHVVLGSAPSFTPYTGSAEDRTTFSFGTGAEYRSLALLTAVKPRSGHLVELSYVNDAPEVHAADTGTVPAPPAAWDLPKVPTIPAVTGLNVVQGGTPAKPTLSISWLPAAGADHYLVEQSVDGVAWTGAGNITGTSLVVEVQPGTIQIRVAGVGLTRGAWAYWTGDAGAVLPPPPNVTNLALAETFTGDYCSITWDATPRSTGYTVQVWANGVLRRTRSVATPGFVYTAKEAIADGGPWRNLTFKVQATGTGTTSAGWATLDVSNPQIGALNNVVITGFLASIMVEYQRPAETDFAGIKVWLSTVDGFTPDNTNLKYSGPDGLVNIDLDPGSAVYYLRVAGYDVWGEDSLTISAQYVSATTLITETQISDQAISTPKLAANSVVADKISVAQLSGISADLGTIIAGDIFGVTGTFSGSLSGADITGATGEFGGTLRAGVVDLTTAAGVTTSLVTTGIHNVTVPDGKTSMRVTLLGGGGGGGGTTGRAGGGGGAGGRAVATFSGLTPGQVYTVTIGAGGTASLTGAGGAGNSTVLKNPAGTAILTANGGGGGGAGTSAAVGAAGTNGTGFEQAATAGVHTSGTQVIFTSDGSRTITTVTETGGTGGAAKLALGAGGHGGTVQFVTDSWNGSSTSLSTAGTDPVGYGAGGRGGAYNTANAPYNSSAGTNGMAIIEQYDPNSVVLYTQYQTLLNALTAQGIATS